MPSFDIVRTWEAPESFRVQSVIGSFTLLDCKLEKRFKGSLPIDEEPWQIGVIVGRSGTGKTSIAKELFGDAYISKFEYTHKSILEDFPEGLSVEDITKALCSVGFKHKTQDSGQQDRRPQGNHTRLGIEPRRNLDQGSLSQTKRNDNWPRPTGRTAVTPAERSPETRTLKRNPRRTTCSNKTIESINQSLGSGISRATKEHSSIKNSLGEITR